MKQIAPLITVTGVDEFTDIAQLQHIIRPGAEAGILVTAIPEGRNRYPGEATIDALTKALTGRCALHICGHRARLYLVNRVYDRWIERACRIQVNGRLSIEEIRNICALFPDRCIITQHGSNNHILASAETAPNHCLLVDSSGGRGLLPGEWVVPKTTKLVGFAGGLSPDNLKHELQRIAEVSAPGWWVDMEGKLRDEQDHFSVERAGRSIDLVLGPAR